MEGPPPQPPVVTQEIQVVDDAGYPRIILSAKSGAPSIVLHRRDAAPAVTIQLDKDDRPSIKFENPEAHGPTAMLEIDDKGAHVKFDRPGGASSYLFLNNGGGSGVVLIDSNGNRRASVVLGPDGNVTIEGVPGGEAQVTKQP